MSITCRVQSFRVSVRFGYWLRLEEDRVGGGGVIALGVARLASMWIATVFDSVS